MNRTPLRAAASRVFAQAIAALALLCSLFVGAAQALSPKIPLIVCRRLPTVSGEEACLRIIEGQFVDWLAAAARDRIQPVTRRSLACAPSLDAAFRSDSLCCAMPAERVRNRPLLREAPAQASLAMKQVAAGSHLAATDPVTMASVLVPAAAISGLLEKRRRLQSVGLLEQSLGRSEAAISGAVATLAAAISGAAGMSGGRLQSVGL